MYQYVACVPLLVSSSAFGCAAHQELGLNADWEKLFHIEQRIKARESGLKLGLSTDLTERFSNQQQWRNCSFFVGKSAQFEKLTPDFTGL